MANGEDIHLILMCVLLVHPKSKAAAVKILKENQATKKSKHAGGVMHQDGPFTVSLVAILLLLLCLLKMYHHFSPCVVVFGWLWYTGWIFCLATNMCTEWRKGMNG